MTPSSSADTIKGREAARYNVDQILSMRSFLPILTHRNVGYVLPQLHLQLGADTLLFVETGSVEPGSAQRFDALARRPAVEAGEPVRANHGVAIRVGVRERPVHQ